MVTSLHPGQVIEPRRQSYGPDINVPLEIAAQRNPGLLDYISQGFAQGAGQGLAQGIPQAFQESQMRAQQAQAQQQKKSAVDSILNQLQPNMSVLDKYKLLAQDPELLKLYEPFLKSEQEQEKEFRKEAELRQKQEVEEEKRKRYADALARASGQKVQTQETEPKEPFSLDKYTDKKDPKRIDISEIPLEDQLIPPPTPEEMQDLTPKEQTDLVKINQRRNEEITKRNDKLNEQALKNTKGFRDEVLSGYKTYKRNSAILTQMNRLNEEQGEGKLSGPLKAKFADMFGIPIGVLGNYNDEQFQKLALDLTGTIMNDYGNKILATEFNTFLRRIPTLQNTQEGRREIIKNMQKIIDYSKRKYQVYRGYTKGRKYPPLDIQERVYDTLDSEVEQQNQAQMQQQNGQKKVFKLPDGRDLTISESQIPKLLQDHPELQSQMGQ